MPHIPSLQNLIQANKYKELIHKPRYFNNKHFWSLLDRWLMLSLMIRTDLQAALKFPIHSSLETLRKKYGSNL